MCPFVRSFVRSFVSSNSLFLRVSATGHQSRYRKACRKDVKLSLSAPAGFQSRPELAELASALWSSSLGVAADRHPWYC